MLDLCERINKSEQNDVVGREAARSIRKVFKSGSDPERRMAARVWLITMGNISAKDYHRELGSVQSGSELTDVKGYATSRKMLQTIEPILKQEAKPPVSQSTYKTTMEIVSGVTYTYHANRSCEGLLDLWNKVRRPGDPEFVSWLLSGRLFISDAAGHSTSRRLPAHHSRGQTQAPAGGGAHRVSAPDHPRNGCNWEPISASLAGAICALAATFRAPLAWNPRNSWPRRIATPGWRPLRGSARPRRRHAPSL